MSGELRLVQTWPRRFEYGFLVSFAVRATLIPGKERFKAGCGPASLQQKHQREPGILMASSQANMPKIRDSSWLKGVGAPKA